MSIRIEWDVPFAGESVPFGELASFVERAASSGADSDTPVAAVAVEQDDSIIASFRVEVDGTPSTSRSTFVCLDRSDVVEAIAVFEAIEDNEGDARMQLGAVRELRQKLTKLAME